MITIILGLGMAGIGGWLMYRGLRFSILIDIISGCVFIILGSALAVL